MKNHADEFEIRKMAQVFKVSCAGYYQYIKRKEAKRRLNDRLLLGKIIDLHKQSNGIYGSPRIHAKLKQQGESCSRRKVAKLMRKNSIQARSRKKWKVSDKACKDVTRIAPNIVAQRFHAPMPNQVWVSDITYIWTLEGWLYVAVIMDLFSRKIVGLSMGDCIDTNLILRAFAQAVCHRSPGRGLILHSDRGSQYTSDRYKHAVNSLGVVLSMSAKGYCYDNAAMESFFGSMKKEHVYLRTYKNRKEAALNIFEYIEVFYNRQRIHSTLGYLSPLEFEERHAAFALPQMGAVG